jgi:hypothetical protein
MHHVHQVALRFHHGIDGLVLWFAKITICRDFNSFQKASLTPV